jgi:hypothetical protein
MMKKLLLRIIVLTILIFIIIVVIIALPLPNNSYNLAIIDKNNLLKKTQSPKIILAGGSNLAFGINSEKIQTALGMPVINMGVHGGFGLGRILDDLSPYLNNGDILVIIPEYSHFSSSWNGEDAAFNLIFDSGFFKNHFNRLLVSTFYGFPKNFMMYLKGKIESIFPHLPNQNAYSRDGFNEYGDYIKHLNSESIQFEPSEAIIMINQSYFHLFLRFVDEFKKRGIMVLISYPCYESESFDASQDFIKELDSLFRTNNLTVISKPDDYRLFREYFYDTSYHLNAEGRQLRTARLIENLLKDNAGVSGGGDSCYATAPAEFLPK